MSEFHTLISVRQQVHAVMSSDHPLARKSTVRLSECVMFPIALPTSRYGVRHLLDIAAHSDENGHRFRRKAATCSDPKRPL